MSIKKGNAAVYWITGLSGSGKTTVSKKFINLLNNDGQKVINFDGDDLRNILGGGFSKNARLKQAQKYSQLCKLFSDQGFTVVAAVGALINSVQQWNRSNINNYVEVFLNVPINELRKRNKKKLYSNFKMGKIRNIVGLDIRAEFPTKPDIELMNYNDETAEKSAEKIYEYHKNLFK